MNAPAIVHDTTTVTADEAGAIHHDAALVVHDRRIAAGRALLPGFRFAHLPPPPGLDIDGRAEP